MDKYTINDISKRRFMSAGCRILLLIIILSFFGCSRQASISPNNKNNEGKPLLALSILPQKWFAQRIAGDRVRTLVLVGTGQNPHNYEPTPSQMKELSQSGAWVLSGAEFEIGLLPKIRGAFSGIAIIDGTAGVTFRMLEPDHHNDDGDEHGHDEHGIDRHTWLGCAPAKILASHIRDALVLLNPADNDLYSENYLALIDEIENDFAALRIELALLRGSSVYVYHPSFGYFLDEFGIRQEAVETGGKEPGPRELARLITEMKQEKIPAIFVQAQFPVNAAKTVAQASGAQLVSLDPLAEDWLANIRVMGNALKNAIQAGADL